MWSNTLFFFVLSGAIEAPVPLSVVTQLPTEPTPEPSQLAPLARAEAPRSSNSLHVLQSPLHTEVFHQVVFMLDPLDTGAEAFVLTAPAMAPEAHGKAHEVRDALHKYFACLHQNNDISIKLQCTEVLGIDIQPTARL